VPTEGDTLRTDVKANYDDVESEPKIQLVTEIPQTTLRTTAPTEPALGGTSKVID